MPNRSKGRVSRAEFVATFRFGEKRPTMQASGFHAHQPAAVLALDEDGHRNVLTAKYQLDLLKSAPTVLQNTAAAGNEAEYTQHRKGRYYLSFNLRCMKRMASAVAYSLRGQTLRYLTCAPQTRKSELGKAGSACSICRYRVRTADPGAWTN
jgi:hypothetical protein